jgi:hypothetical protein
MNLKSILARPFALYVHKQVKRGMSTALQDQEAILKKLLNAADKTEFGKEHNFSDITDYDIYAKTIPIRDYEQFKPYINKIKEGKHNILWKGKPIYLAKTSGTTSGIKYIPISKESISNHINSARNALLCYMAETGNTAFADSKMIFLSGSPELERIAEIPTGRLSGIVNHHIPKYLRTQTVTGLRNKLHRRLGNELDKIVAETINEDLALISGIPPWVQMYFDRLDSKIRKKDIGSLSNFQFTGSWRCKLSTV